MPPPPPPPPPGPEAPGSSARRSMGKAALSSGPPPKLLPPGRCCGGAARDYPGESASMDGRLAVVRGSVGSDYRGFTFIHVASLRLASEEEAPLWTLLTPRVADGWDG